MTDPVYDRTGCYACEVSGTLFVIATPLGNLDDLAPRARATLEQVSLIACEDTRRTAKLLQRFEIQTPTVSCHKFNEDRRLEQLLDRLRGGEDLALVSDGGTPAISDPGSLLVAAALGAGLTVTPIPGPSAVTTLLSAAGLPADRFVFDGFLPHRGGERRRRLRDLATETRTTVVYETPHRILDALRDIESILGERPLVLGRELTKAHEEILRGTAPEILGRLTAPSRGDSVRGEIVLAWAGHDGSAAPLEDEAIALFRRQLTAADGDRRRALKETARLLGIKKAELSRRLAESPDSP